MRCSWGPQDWTKARGSSLGKMNAPVLRFCRMRVRLLVCSAPLSVPSSGASTDTLLPAVPAPTPPPLPAVAAAEPGGVQPLPPAGEPLPLVPDVPVPAVPPSPCGSIIAEAWWGGLRNAVLDSG